MSGLYHHPPFWLHRLPAGGKLLALAILSVGIMGIALPLGLASALIIISAIFLVPRYGLRRRLRALAALWPIAVAIFISQLLAVGLESAVIMLLRLFLMMMLADLVTLSTTMQAMMDALEPILRPLRRAGLNTSRFTFAIALTIRFVPLLVHQWRHMAEAWRARTGKRATVRMVAPFVANILRMADHTAEALDARGFGANLHRSGIRK